MHSFLHADEWNEGSKTEMSETARGANSPIRQLHSNALPSVHSHNLSQMEILNVWLCVMNCTYFFTHLFHIMTHEQAVIQSYYVRVKDPSFVPSSVSIQIDKLYDATNYFDIIQREDINPMNILITKLSKDQWYDLSSKKDKFNFPKRHVFYVRYAIMSFSGFIKRLLLKLIPSSIQLLFGNLYHRFDSSKPSQEKLLSGLLAGTSFIAVTIVYNLSTKIIIDDMKYI
ncbi:hypothetical protein RFI_20182 [Reticulomyxa filosa]|uniref:Uncharacterized protein n=1 Tax=Reticulomyxa filosa TaxID=46433 RepID=X6MT35_RETFI|nr:hypothetical protein RFI_20182 [Reticulomyxa filosa]|eukprot:ETO17148.1 hypothetical protein RFI_20182 [Reticulomyxa filosa]